MEQIGLILIMALGVFYDLLSFAILIKCILSWFPINHNNIICRIIDALTEPILGPIRRMMQRSPLGGGMMLDFSPVIAYILMSIVYSILRQAIYAIFL